jgi:hypothetical protein
MHFVQPSNPASRHAFCRVGTTPRQEASAISMCRTGGGAYRSLTGAGCSTASRPIPCATCPDRDPHLFLRAHHGRAENEGGGSPAARRGLAAPAARERRQASHHAVPSCARRGAARLYCRAGIAEDRKGWLFRTSRGHNATVLSEQPMNQSDAWCMIRRRAVAAGIHAPIGNHTFRATGITAYLVPMAARSNTRRRWPRMKPAHDQAL